jgi:hypothetical protein
MSLLYGVNKATLDAYVAAERAKVWEEAACLLEASMMPLSRFAMKESLIAYYRKQAAKETQP